VHVVGGVVIALALLAGLAVVLALTRSPMSRDDIDRVDAGLPDRELRADDIAHLRFRIGLRGYRMDDVDVALDRLAAALRDAESRSAQ
jgi:DivIVA domain-containing protein